MGAVEMTVFQGNRPRSVIELRDWHACLSTPREPALEPTFPIVDAHHHVYGSLSDSQHYRIEDLALDLSSGHRITGTVHVEAFASGWLGSGPVSMRSIGEVKAIVRASSEPMHTGQGACQVAAGIVSNVDLMLGDRVAPVLEAHLAAGQGRLRGVRHHGTRDEGLVGKFIHNAPQHLLANREFRRGFAWLERFGLSFDAVVFHTQLAELADLVDAFPNTPFILNHIGMVIGVAEYAQGHGTHLAEWRRQLQALAARPNVSVKLGGMGMVIFGFGFEQADRPATSLELAQAWQPFVDVCVNAFGPRRCMFESNFPMDKQSCGYTELWNAFKLTSRHLTADERSHLFYRTACNAYRLPELARLCDELNLSAHSSGT